MDSTHGHPDSANSSPRSQRTDYWGDTLPPPVLPGTSIPASTKLRLMCSYGGRIVPRPHDKNLCYVGGETRIIALDRQSNLADLSAQISKTLLDGAAGFSVKYQLPHEDLDSLISVTTDEDLENMIEEYDRTVGGVGNPGRLRLFLFPAQPVSAASSSIGSIIDDSKSESWFVDALNGAPGLPRLSSDSNSVNCLLGLDDAVPVANGDMGLMVDPLVNKTEIYSVPESPMVDSASFGDEQFAALLAAKGNDEVTVPNPAVRVSSEDERRPLAPPYTAVHLESAATINRDNFAPPIQHPNPAMYSDSISQFASRPVTPPPMITVAGGDVDQPRRIDPSQQTHQYFPAGAQYFQHTATGDGAVPFTPYYIHPQQPPAAVQQQLHQQQYQQVYFIPVGPNLGQHSAAPQQLYPTRTAPSPMQRPKPANTAGSAAVQQHFAGYQQSGANFAYQYVDPMQAGFYYTQPGASPMAVPSQYQTVSTAAGMTEGVAESKMQNKS